MATRSSISTRRASRERFAIRCTPVAPATMFRTAGSRSTWNPKRLSSTTRLPRACGPLCTSRSAPKSVGSPQTRRPFSGVPVSLNELDGSSLPNRRRLKLRHPGRSRRSLAKTFCLHRGAGATSRALYVSAWNGHVGRREPAGVGDDSRITCITRHPSAIALAVPSYTGRRRRSGGAAESGPAPR